MKQGMDDCEVERTSERSNEGMNPEMEELMYGTQMQVCLKDERQN